MSTVNSLGGGGLHGGAVGAANGGLGAPHAEHYHQILQLREENTRLLGQLLSMQQNYQELLKSNLADQRMQLQVLASQSSPQVR